MKIADKSTLSGLSTPNAARNLEKYGVRARKVAATRQGEASGRYEGFAINQRQFEMAMPGTLFT